MSKENFYLVVSARDYADIVDRVEEEALEEVKLQLEREERVERLKGYSCNTWEERNDFSSSGMPSPIESGTYVVNADGTNFYKIGRSIDIDGRIRSLQSACPLPLTLIAANKDRAVEEELHVKFAKLRVHGEWFELTKEHIDYLVEFMGFKNVTEEIFNDRKRFYD